MCRRKAGSAKAGRWLFFFSFLPLVGWSRHIQNKASPLSESSQEHAHREPRVCFARLDIHHVNNQLGFVRRQTPWAFSDFPNHTVRLWRSGFKLCVLQPPRQTNSMIVVVFCLQCKGMKPTKALGLRDRCSTTEL